jgi:arylsulfatase
VIGEPEGLNTNYPVAWSQATNVPFRFWKSDANSEGGTRNPLIVYYPKGIAEKGGIRNQYSHVTDIYPTTLELLDIRTPEQIGGVVQIPVQGTSLVYSFNDRAAVSRHTVQYTYFLGSGSIYKDGWKASFASHPDAIDARLASFRGDANPLQRLQELAASKNSLKWELYNLNEDFNERINLVDKNPQKLEELQAEFDRQAQENKVYPLLHFSDIINQDALKAFFEQEKRIK